MDLTSSKPFSIKYRKIDFDRANLPKYPTTKIIIKNPKTKSDLSGKLNNFTRN
tara:strand:+ start:354 stop:512 length:159 start_codon:yes stop_codon:yes gene_type:complete